MHGRLYDPVLGQFLSPDPMLQVPFSQGLNRFAYVFNNPHGYVDPSGFEASATTVGIDVGIGAAYGAGLYATLAGGSAAGVGAGVEVGAEVGAGTGLGAGVGLAEVLETAAPLASGAAIVVNTAIVSGVHPPAIAAKTVQPSARGAHVSDAHSPSLGRTSTAVGTAPVTEKVPAPKPASDSEWGPTPDTSHVPGAYESTSVPNKILSNKEFKVVDTSETWKNLFEVATIFVPGAGEEEVAAEVAERLIAKSVNLPGWRKVTVDMAHILERHVPGSIYSEGRSVFPGTMNAKGIARAIREAYQSSTKVAVQGDRVLLQGRGAGLTIEMWFNKATKVIETAYPK